MRDAQEPEGVGSRSGLLKSSGLVSVMTLISRVLGLVRDMVIANYFGSSAGADSFFLAFKIPNFFRRLFGEGAFSQAFVPVLSEYRTQKSKTEVRNLIGSIGGTLGMNLVVVTVLGVAGAPFVISLFAIGFVVNGETEKLQLATEMLRLTFPYVLLICMTAFSGSVLNSYGRFGVPAFTPVFLNISLIAAAIGLTPYLDTPVVALAWGVLIAGVAQLCFQLPFLAREGLLVWPTINFRHPGVKQVATLMLPALLGVSVGQINLLLDTVLASFLETGSLSWLYYSDRLLELPLALFGITIATVILPTLSRQHAAESGNFKRTMDWAVKLVLLLGLPASVALVVLAEPLITTLFFQGQMTTRDVQMAGLSLAAYGVGLLGHMLVKVLAPAYFSRQDTRSPVKYGLVALVSNMVLNLALIWHFKHAGLALATSLSAFINAGLLWWGLRQRGIWTGPSKLWAFLLKLLIANGLMVLFLVWVLPNQADLFEMQFWWRMGFVLLVCGGGALVYALGLLAMGLRPKDLG